MTSIPLAIEIKKLYEGLMAECRRLQEEINMKDREATMIQEQNSRLFTEARRAQLSEKAEASDRQKAQESAARLSAMLAEITERYEAAKTVVGILEGRLSRCQTKNRRLMARLKAAKKGRK